MLNVACRQFLLGRSGFSGVGFKYTEELDMLNLFRRKLEQLQQILLLRVEVW